MNCDTQVKQGSVVGDVKDKDAIVFEDEISTGGTLLETAKTLAAAGARQVIAGATHGVLVGSAIENLSTSAIESVIVTNTVAIPEKKRLRNLSVLSVAPLMAEAIRRIHTGESVGELFT